MVESDEGSVSSNEALNLVSSLPDGVKMTISDAENLVRKMKDDKWLSESVSERNLFTLLYFCNGKVLLST